MIRAGGNSGKCGLYGAPGNLCDPAQAPAPNAGLAHWHGGRAGAMIGP
jgi:hypothetical protein